MTREIQELTKEENTFIALLKFWGSHGYLQTKKLDSNKGKNLKFSIIQSYIKKICDCKNLSRTELEELSVEFANYINRDFLNQTFSYFVSSKNHTPRIFLKVVKAELNSKNKIRPSTFMSFWERELNRYDEILENPMACAGSGTGNFMRGRDFGYLVVRVPEDFPVIETRNFCDPDEVLISSDDLLTRDCVLTFIPRPLEGYERQGGFFEKLFGNF